MNFPFSQAVRRVQDFLRHQIWEQDLTTRSWLESFAIRQLRVAIIVGKGWTQGAIALRASSMTFTTLLTLVPLLIIAFTVLRGFGGLSDLELRVENFVLENLVPGAQTQARDWLRGFFENLRSGAFNGITLVLLLGGVLGLLSTIEAAFNDIWGVRRGRGLFHRFSTYTTLVVFSPILIGLSLSMTASLQSSIILEQILQRTPQATGLIATLFKFVPIFLTGSALTLLYMIMPNVRVRLRAAIPAGIVAAVIWEASKIGYTAYLRGATHYATLYGSLAAFPLFLLWIYLSWVVVLFGAHLTFAQEAADDIREEEMASRVSQRERVRVALHLALEAARNYTNGVSPPEIVEVSHRIGLPLRLVRDVAEILTSGGILNVVVQPRKGEGGLVPGRSPDQITVYEVVRCMLTRGHVPTSLRASGAAELVDRIMGDIDHTLHRDWASVSLADCLNGHALDNLGEASSSPEVVPFPKQDSSPRSE